MKKKLIYGLSALMLASSSITFTGCIEEVVPTDSATAEQVGQSTTATESLLQGAPAYLTGIWSTDNHWSFGYGAIMRIRDIQCGDLGFNPDGANYNQFWYWYYNQGMGRRYLYAQFTWNYQTGLVNTVNKLIQTVDPETANDETLGYLGAALAFRAMAYLDMAREYEWLPNDLTQGVSPEGNDITGLTVPIVDENTDEQTATNNPRAKKADMADFILGDLQKAEQYIPNLTLQGQTLPHLDCVYGLMARCYMWLEDYPNAEKYARMAIDAATTAPLTREEALSTTDGYNDITKWMWGAQYTTGNVSNLLNWTAFASNEAVYGYSAPVSYGSTDCSSIIDADMYSRINDTDWRKLEWKAPAGSPLEGQNIYIDEGVGNALVAYASLKFRPNDGNINDYMVGNVSAFPLMRVEEMYFIEAEAAAHQDAARGKQLVENFMRTYRDSEYTCNASSTEDVVEEVVFQKRVELWGEGQVFFDVKRLDYSVTRGYEGSNHDPRSMFNTDGRPSWMNWAIVEQEENSNAGVRGYNNPDPGEYDEWIGL